MNFTFKDFMILLGFLDSENERLDQENEELRQQLYDSDNEDEEYQDDWDYDPGN